MQIKPIGRLVLLIVFAGIAFGGWRWWQSRAPRGNTPPVATGARPGNQSAPTGNTADEGGVPLGNPAGNPDATNAGSGTAIPLITSATKRDWLQNQIDAFNAQSQGKYRITPKFLETREAMHAILAGKEKPVLWSPSSPVWSARLGDAWVERTGNELLDLGDPNGHRVYLRSPLVVLTRRAKAPYLRRVLGGARPWDALRAHSLERRRAPWGKLRWAHADPLSANSGFMTLGLILAEYADQAGRSLSLERVAQSAGFIQFLRELERSLVLDEPVEKGTSALTQAFLDDPNRYDFITTYESNALASAQDNPDIVVIYPNPTVVSEHAVTLLGASGVSAEQREGARAFLQFLSGRTSLEDGVRSNLRPVLASGALSLTPTLARYPSQGFQQSYTAIELPPYEALNTAAYQWRLHVARKPPR